MSIEEKIDQLIAALDRNTTAHAGTAIITAFNDAVSESELPQVKETKKRSTKKTEPEPPTGIDLKKISLEQIVGLVVLFGKLESYSEEALAQVDALIHGNESNDDTATMSAIITAFNANPASLKMFPETQLTIANRVEQQYTTLPEQKDVIRFVFELTNMKPGDRETAEYVGETAVDYLQKARDVFKEAIKGGHQVQLQAILKKYNTTSLTSADAADLPKIIADAEALKNA